MLNQTEAAAIDAQVASVEAATGVEVVAALTAKADAYVELPWKAFALGASLFALGGMLLDLVRPDWATLHGSLVAVVAILGGGAASALAAVFVPGYARLFLRPVRAEIEVRQYAKALFLERELFRTQRRTGVLMLVALFERRIEILPDVGFRDRVSTADWQGVVARMTPLLEQARAVDALHEGLRALQEVLIGDGFHGVAGAVNELRNCPIDDAGARE
jgi:putative membrane protein